MKYVQDEAGSARRKFLAVGERLLCTLRTARSVERPSDTEARLHPVAPMLIRWWVGFAVRDATGTAEIDQRLDQHPPSRSARQRERSAQAVVSSGVDVIGTV